MQKHRLTGLISRLYKPELDPGRAARVHHEFDVERGYTQYHQRCRAAFARGSAPLQRGPLHELGFEYLNVLDTTRVRALLLQVGTDGPIVSLKKNTRGLEGLPIRLKDQVEFVLAEVLTPEVDTRLVSFFQSEYLVHWLTLSVTRPVPRQASVSFRWHCDSGPTGHLKLIVYLNGSDEHGGNTAFVPLAETARVAAKGYVFGRTRNRTSDVAHLSQIAGQEINAHEQPMKAGDGVVFQPARVLHRGLSPQHGPRYALTLCLLPSPIPWQDALTRGTLSDLAVDDKWHRHASDLLTALACGPM